MDYEKKYNEALSQARFYYGNCPTEPEKKKLENIFPELRESKDEKIRKALIQEFKEKVQKSFEWKDGIPNNAVLDWLEKQKEQKPINSFDIVPYIDDKIAALQDMWREEKVAFDWDDMHEMIEDVARHFYQKEQKPAWGEEDEYRIRQIERITKQAGCSQGLQEVIHNWLKSLRPQPKQEWSKEDEDKLYQVMETLLADKTVALRDNPHCKALHEAYDDMLAWIKSIRPSWKPSEEQMKALNAMNCYGELSYQGQQQLLIDLYQQLKKL